MHNISLQTSPDRHTGLGWHASLAIHVFSPNDHSVGNLLSYFLISVRQLAT